MKKLKIQKSVLSNFSKNFNYEKYADKYFKKMKFLRYVLSNFEKTLKMRKTDLKFIKKWKIRKLCWKISQRIEILTYVVTIFVTIKNFSNLSKLKKIENSTGQFSKIWKILRDVVTIFHNIKKQKLKYYHTFKNVKIYKKNV